MILNRPSAKKRSTMFSHDALAGVEAIGDIRGRGHFTGWNW